MSDLVAEQALRLIDRYWELRADGIGAWPHPLWSAIADAGFLDFLVPAEQGGIGASLAETVAFLKVVGSRAVPLPVAETIIGRGILASLLLPMPETGHPIGMVFGTGPVPWARHAQTMVQLDGTMARIAGAGEWKITAPAFDLAGRPCDDITLIDLPAREIPGLPLSPAPLFALFRAAQIAGAMTRILTIATTYAQERVQFGRPIGKFQAIQQMAAEMAALSAAAEVAVEAAVTHPASDILAMSAKARASEACARVAAIAHQMIGALGYTQEFALHHFTRLIWAWRHEAGDEHHWQSELASAMLLNSNDFWTFITDCESSPAPKRNM